MKKLSNFYFIILILPFLFTVLNSNGQSFKNDEKWTRFNYKKMSVSMPQATKQRDSLNVNLFLSEIDSAVALITSVVPNSGLNTKDSVFQKALEMNGLDTLKAIAQVSLVIGSSTLTSLEKIKLVSGISGLEYSFRYDDLKSNKPMHTFMLIFLNNDFFYCLSATGTEDSLERLLHYKHLFFNSLNISQ